jgi:hypothetical protein
MEKRNIYIGGCILALLIGFAFWSPPSKQNLCKGNTRPIPFKRLSDEKNFPFLDSGRPLSYLKNKAPNYNEYRAAVSRFSNVRACLIAQEKEEQHPNLTRFDWNEVKAQEDAEVCIFRVVSSLGGADETKQWLNSQGFELIPSYNKNSVSGLWNTDKCGQRFVEKSKWHDWIDQLLGLKNVDFWVSARFSADNEVTNVGVGFNSK